MNSEEREKMFDTAMEQHALDLADQYLRDTRPVTTAPAAPYAGPRAWFVVQTVSRGEDDVVDILTERGHDAFLPRMKRERWHRKAKRVVTLDLILFNRYVFARLPASPSDWGDLCQQEEVHGVVGYLSRADVLLMERIREKAAAGGFDDTAEADAARLAEAKANARANRREIERMFPLGSRVKATRGPFGGFSGLVTNVTGRGMVQAMVAMFGRLTPVEFEAAALDVIPAEDESPDEG